MSGFVGSCYSMCPQNERKMRIKMKRVHILEKDDERCLMVKEFIRAGAGNKVYPTELRPAKILLQATLYLINQVVPRKDVSIHEVYNFVFDRFRAIRQDLTIQKIEDDIAIKIYEVITRYLIHSSYVLCGDGQFCSPTNMKHIVECLNKLASLYRSGNHKVEFLSYQLLACFGNVDVIMYALQQDRLRQHGMMKTVILMNMSWVKGNYLKVLKLARNLTPLQACIFHYKLNLVRLSFLKIMSSAYLAKNLSFPLKHLSEILLYDGGSELKDCRDLIVSCGLTLVDDDRVVFCGRKFVMPSVLQLPSSWVDSQLGTNLQSVICGSSDHDDEDIIQMVETIKIVC